MVDFLGKLINAPIKKNKDIENPYIEKFLKVNKSSKLNTKIHTPNINRIKFKTLASMCKGDLSTISIIMVYHK